MRTGLGRAGILALVFHIGCHAPSTSSRPTVVTFNQDIAPLIWKHCSTCHRPGELAPFSLLDYRDVRTHARQIVAVLQSGVMPPWPPESGYGTFVGERHVPREEIERMARWVEQGAPEGNTEASQSPPEWTEGWQLGEPDLVVELPEPYSLRASGPDVFRNFVIPIPVLTARYVRGMEVRPGSRNVVHHASILVDRTRASRQLDEEDPEPGYEGMFPEGARNPGSLALGWTPGMTPYLEPAARAWQLERGSDLVVQLHMLPSGKPETVQMQIGFFFSDSRPTRIPIDFKLGSKTIDIPAGDAKYMVEDTYTLPVDVEVVSVYPHAHYLAKDMKAFATLPSGTVQWLIWIRDWNFNWQDQYRYVTPLVLPAGTVLTMRYTYDNSSENPRNPHHPPRHVVHGPESSDEMGDLWLRLLPRTLADAEVLARSYVEHEARKDIALAEQMVLSQPDQSRWYTLLGARLIEAGRVGEGIARLEQALRLGPDHAEAHNNLGHALRLQGRLVDAITHFRYAVKLAPNNDRIHVNLAEALQDVGNLDEAIAHFRRALALNPDAPDTHNNLGVALGSRGITEEAIRHFEQALEIQPSYIDAQKNLELARSLK